MEFALVLPVFMLLLFGLIDMGRYVYLNSTLSQAAREAARVAAVEASWVGKAGVEPSCGTAGGPVCPANLAALRADMIALSDLYTSCASTAPSPVTTQTCADGSINRYVSVRVVMVFRPITPVVSSMFSSITTQASASMVIN